MEPLSERLGNGVKRRMDGKGDAWANAHRDQLGTGHQMQDIDASFGFTAFGSNTGEKLFLEYEPDNYVHREKVLRSFAVVAMFDRKLSETAAFGPRNTLCMAFYLWQCRLFSQWQPKAPRFFIVVGGQKPPWRMIEIDINSGERIGQPVDVTGSNFAELWAALGLGSLRRELRIWITSEQRERQIAVALQGNPSTGCAADDGVPDWVVA